MYTKHCVRVGGNQYNMKAAIALNTRFFVTQLSVTIQVVDCMLIRILQVTKSDYACYNHLGSCR